MCPESAIDVFFYTFLFFYSLLFSFFYFLFFLPLHLLEPRNAVANSVEVAGEVACDVVGPVVRRY
jgi:hypothetical protein